MLAKLECTRNRRRPMSSPAVLCLKKHWKTPCVNTKRKSRKIYTAEHVHKLNKYQLPVLSNMRKALKIERTRYYGQIDVAGAYSIIVHHLIVSR